MKIAVITANFGNYDSFKEPNNIKNVELFDWFYFTDNTEITSNIYKIITKSYHSEQNKNVLKAKYYKVQHHQIDFLNKYEYIIWHDASLNIQNTNFVHDILKLISSEPNMILFTHPCRKTVKEEVTILNTIKKFKDQDFTNQFEIYIKNGFIDDAGLYAMGFFCRKIEPIINKLFDEWFTEINTYTVRDQVSFPYLLWKNKVEPAIIITEKISNNKLIGQIIKHK